MTQISTSITAAATAYSNQRKIDRTSNGVLWATYMDVISGGSSRTPFETAYSLDDGASWSAPATISNGSNTAGSAYIPNFSFFIDQDDFAHIVFKDNATGYIYYRRGTPNAGRTAWTWSGPTTILANSDYDYPDIVVHREGTGWAVHIVVSNASIGPYYQRRIISSTGVVGASVGGAFLATDEANAVHKFPSLDLNHTGDGKTIKDGTPHLYVAWSAGARGAGAGIRFKKAAYSAAWAWNWGTEREIDSGRYIDSADKWINCLFDGTRVVIASSSRSTTNDLALYERDAADTATTTLALLTNMDPLDLLLFGSATYDGAGNVYLFGANGDGAGIRVFGYRKYDRASGVLESRVTLDATAGTPYASAKRGYSNNKIEFVYGDGINSPYSVNYSFITPIPPITATDISVRLTTSAGSAGNTNAQSDANLSLGGYTSTTEVDGFLFDDITAQENKSKVVDYRAVDVVNNHPSQSLSNTFIHIMNTADGSVVEAAADPTGPVDVTASVQGETIPNDTTVPPAMAYGGEFWLSEMLTDTQRFAEFDDGAWWNWNNADISTAHAHSGTASWSCPADLSTSADINGRTGINVPVDWTFSGWLYQDTGSTRTIRIEIDPVTSYYNQQVTIPSGVWTPFTISGTSKFYLAYLMPAWDYPTVTDWLPGETFYFDDLSVTYKPVEPDNIYLGNIGPGQMRRVWLRRTAQNSVSVQNEGLILYVTADGPNGMNSYTATSEGTAQSPTWGLPTQYSEATFAVSTEQAHSGTKSLKVTSLDYEGVGVTVYGTDPVTPMVFSGWIYQASGSPQSFSFAGMSDVGYFESGSGTTIPSGIWTRFESLIDPGYPGVVVYPTEAEVTFYLDDLAYTPGNIVGPNMSADSIEQLTVHQRTAEGSGIPWLSTSTGQPGRISATKAHTGTHSWAIDAPQYYQLLFQIPKHDWMFSAWVYQETGTERDVGIGVDSNDNWFEEIITVPSGVWTQISVTGTSDIVDAYIFATTGWTSGEVLYFDDASLSVTVDKGATIYWNVEAFVFPPTYVWDGSSLINAQILGVWNGTDITPPDTVSIQL